jgi:hypothetical protein
VTDSQSGVQPVRLGTHGLDVRPDIDTTEVGEGTTEDLAVVLAFPTPSPPARVRLRDQLPEPMRSELDRCFAAHPCNAPRGGHGQEET